MPENPQPGRLAPHNLLDRRYASDRERRAYVDGLFDASARHYDWINAMMSFGSGRWYRRQALLRAGLAPGMTVLDVGTGTGVVAELAHGLVGPTGRVIALDPSRGMLLEAGKRAGPLPVQALGEALPLATASVDRLTMGYALRHVADLRLTFSDYFRVLKPGGRLLLLEITRPSSALYYPLKGYLKYAVPALTRLTRGSRPAQTLMAYYWDTIEHCVDPDTILGALREVGYVDVGRRVELHMFSEYGATRPT